MTLDRAARRLLLLLFLLVPLGATAAALEPHPFFRDLERPDSPNNWLIAPEGFPGAPDETAPVFAVSAARLEELFLTVAREEGARAPHRQEEGFLCLVDETALLGFEDDVCAQFIAQGPDSATLAVYSASRVGYWDFGKNRSRLEGWIARLQGRIAGN